MIIALLQCPLTNLHRTYNSLLGAVGSNLGDLVVIFLFSFSGPLLFWEFCYR